MSQRIKEGRKDWEYFDVLPQHKNMVIKRLKSENKINITEDKFQELQSEENFVNLNYRQAEYLRRILILRNVCDPIARALRF